MSGGTGGSSCKARPSRGGPLARASAPPRAAALGLGAGTKLWGDEQDDTSALRAIVEGSLDAVLVLDDDLCVHLVNQQTEALFALPREQLHGRGVDALLPGARIAGLAFCDERVTTVTAARRADGSEFHAEVSVMPIDGAGAGRVALFVRDLTLRDEADETLRRLRAQMILSDRMASVGALAAGVAHEINNPLAYVLSNLELIADELAEMGGHAPAGRMKDLTEMVENALEGANRVRKIVRGLKTFSRADEERRVVLDARAVLDVSINMAHNEIKHRARLVREYGPVPLVEADDARLGQVFVNLLVNAAQAIPTGHVDGHEIRIVTSTSASGQAVIQVRDTGPGIPADILGRIFDPFFTTKAVGEGTGLGLSICHSIVSGLGGQITATSDPGRGTAFEVTLPAAAEQAPVTRRAPSLRPGSRRTCGPGPGPQ